MPPNTRVSQERAALESLRAAIANLPAVEAYSGLGCANRFAVAGWELTPLQYFQYGDLRVETARTTIIVEVESGGGVGNLVKYWPLLTAGVLAKRLLLLHAFQVSSAGDYIAHRRLWESLVDRMRSDLEVRGVRWGSEWEARIFTYRAGERLADVAAALREAAEASP